MNSTQGGVETAVSSSNCNCDNCENPKLYNPFEIGVDKLLLHHRDNNESSEIATTKTTVTEECECKSPTTTAGSASRVASGSNHSADSPEETSSQFVDTALEGEPLHGDGDADSSEVPKREETKNSHRDEPGVNREEEGGVERDEDEPLVEETGQVERDEVENILETTESSPDVPPPSPDCLQSSDCRNRNAEEVTSAAGLQTTAEEEEERATPFISSAAASGAPSSQDFSSTSSLSGENLVKIQTPPPIATMGNLQPSSSSTTTTGSSGGRLPPIKLRADTVSFRKTSQAIGKSLTGRARGLGGLRDFKASQTSTPDFKMHACEVPNGGDSATSGFSGGSASDTSRWPSTEPCRYGLGRARTSVSPTEHMDCDAGVMELRLDDGGGEIEILQLGGGGGGGGGGQKKSGSTLNTPSADRQRRTSAPSGPPLASGKSNNKFQAILAKFQTASGESSSSSAAPQTYSYTNKGKMSNAGDPSDPMGWFESKEPSPARKHTQSKDLTLTPRGMMVRFNSGVGSGDTIPGGEEPIGPNSR